MKRLPWGQKEQAVWERKGFWPGYDDLPAMSVRVRLTVRNHTWLAGNLFLYPCTGTVHYSVLVPGTLSHLNYSIVTRTFTAA